jgi:hypothetical protein
MPALTLLWVCPWFHHFDIFGGGVMNDGWHNKLPCLAEHASLAHVYLVLVGKFDLGVMQHPLAASISVVRFFRG